MRGKSFCWCLFVCESQDWASLSHKENIIFKCVPEYVKALQNTGLWVNPEPQFPRYIPDVYSVVLVSVSSVWGNSPKLRERPLFFRTVNNPRTTRLKPDGLRLRWSCPSCKGAPSDSASTHSRLCLTASQEEVRLLFCVFVRRLPFAAGGLSSDLWVPEL